MKRIGIILCVYSGLTVFSDACGVTIQQRSKVSGASKTIPGKTIVIPPAGSTSAAISTPQEEISASSAPDIDSDASTLAIPSKPIPVPTKQPGTTPVVITQKPIINANIYLINIMPFPLQISYQSKTKYAGKSITQGPAIIYPGQTVKILQFSIVSDLQPKQIYNFSVGINGTIPEEQGTFNIAALQRIINTENGTNFEYSLMGVTPQFRDIWISHEKDRASKITIGQTEVFLDYIAQENKNSTDAYYSVSPKQIAFKSDTIQTIIGKDFKTIGDLPPRIWKEMFFTSSSALKKLDAWIPARPEIRYDQTSFLGTHASFANTGAGFSYAKQLWTIQQQLDNGVRVLQLNFSPDGSAPEKMCLESCEISKYLKTGTPRMVLELLKTLKTWLDKNQNEVLTIILDNKLTADTTFRLFKQADLAPLLLTKEIWEPLNRSGSWPRIGWMQLYKRRLVVFDRSENKPDQYGYSAKQYLIQNTPGTLDITQAAKLFGPIVKPTPRLFQCNYYGAIGTPLPLQNDSTQIKKLIDAVRANKYLEPNQTPNFIMLDHVEMGNPMTLINQLNKAAQSQ